VGRAEQLSVSHTKDLLVVALSKDRVGVDIERLDRRYQRILAKYLTAEEQQLSADPHFPAAAWCAKEAIYKWAGIRGLSFEEVQIQSFDGEYLTASVRGGEPVTLSISYPDDEHIMAYL
ncbi:MAG: 4-phosphopantetheinyl transferase family protein, partial [Alistipes sp.]|nr:4-phosphopantetheinyl transferase family protein [Alistipes sp.]